jgi:nucleotide-binding universal stress UspA family protein
MGTILIGVDNSEASNEAIEYCRRTYDPEDVEFLAVNVVPAVPDEVKDEVWEFETSAGDKGVYEMETEMMDHATDLVDEAVSPLRDAGFTVNVETKLGHPGAELCQLAEAHDADSIVVGRSGRGVMSEVVLGSVSHYVIHHAHRPVVVVPAVTEE